MAPKVFAFIAQTFMVSGTELVLRRRAWIPRQFKQSAVKQSVPKQTTRRAQADCSEGDSQAERIVRGIERFNTEGAGQTQRGVLAASQRS
jgi:hypothetical protein